MINNKSKRNIDLKFMNLFWKFVLGSLLCLSDANANSFVGNGGNAGDIELMVTKKQIKDSMLALQNSDSSYELCDCIPVFNNRKECEPLGQINDEQKKFCALQLKKNASQIISLFQDSKLSFHWTDQQISVNDNGLNVVADAVASPDEKKITLNKKTFLNLPQTQRVSLLMHELMHLIPVEGDLLSDSGGIGPFTNQQGQREFINAIAAETVMHVYRNGLFQKYQGVLSRGQSYHSNWVDFTFVSTKSLDSNSNTYNSDGNSGIELSYKKYFNKLGVNLGYKHLWNTEGLLTDIEVEERKNILSLGLTYRFFMGDDPLSAYGQSFVNLDLNLDFVSSQYFVSDSFISTTSQDSALGFSANAKYYYPMNPVWLVVGFGFEQHSYKHEILNLEKNAINMSAFLGVSHGF
jgi:hypothetical protein